MAIALHFILYFRLRSSAIPVSVLCIAYVCSVDMSVQVCEWDVRDMYARNRKWVIACGCWSLISINININKAHRTIYFLTSEGQVENLI